jgi:hypothetical protein
MKTGVGGVIAIFTAIVGLAMVAVLVSQRSNTSSVISALTSGGSSLIGAAVAPVTQSSSN